MMSEPSSSFSSLAPRSRITRNAERSSLEDPGFLICDTDFEINAAAQALCMELFEAGACTIPLIFEGEIVTFINLSGPGNRIKKFLELVHWNWLDDSLPQFFQ